MIIRIAISLLIVSLISLLPWWVIVILLSIALIIFKSYYEAVFIGLILDAVYGTAVIYPAYPYIFTMFAVLILIFSRYLRERILVYN